MKKFEQNYQIEIPVQIRLVRDYKIQVQSKSIKKLQIRRIYIQIIQTHVQLWWSPLSPTRNVRNSRNCFPSEKRERQHEGVGRGKFGEKNQYKKHCAVGDTVIIGSGTAERRCITGAVTPWTLKGGETGAQVSLHDSIISNSMIYQDRLETNLLKLSRTHQIQNGFP